MTIVDTPDAPEEANRPTRRSKRGRRTVKRVAAVLIFFLVVNYLVLPQIAGARKSASLLSAVNLPLLILSVAFQCLAILVYAQLTRSILPKEGRLPLHVIIRVQLSTIAASHLVPGGTAAGAPLGYRLLTRQGLPGSDAAFAMATQSIGSAIVLNVLLWTALVISIPIHGFSAVYGTAAIVGAVLIGLFVSLVLLLLKGEDRAVRIFEGIGRRLPFLDSRSLGRSVRRMAGRLRELLANRPVVVKAVGWATVNWLCDAASLYFAVGAFHVWPGPVEVIVSYGLANVLAAIPLAPGGLGVVETALTTSLVGFGIPRGNAILGVLAYRLINFWLPIPFGGGAYISLRVREAKETPREALREFLDYSVDSAEDRRSWAARHGVNLHRKRKRPPADSEHTAVSYRAKR